MIDGMSYCRGCSKPTFSGPVCVLCKQAGRGDRKETKSLERTIGKSDDDTHFVVGPKVKPPGCAGCSKLHFCAVCDAETCHCLGECVGCAVRRRDNQGNSLGTTSAACVWLLTVLAISAALTIASLAVWHWVQ